MNKWIKGILIATMTTLSLGSLSAFTTIEAEESQALTIYSNALSNGRQEWLTEKAAEAGFQLEFVSGGSGDIYNRLLAEAGSPQADVTFGMDEINWKTITEEGLVRQYEPEWITDLPEDAIVGNGYYHPTTEERITMYYNPEFISEEELPTMMEDFGQDDKFTEKYRVPIDFGGSTNQKIAISILLQHQDPDGELGISDEGWDKLSDFLMNGYAPAESEEHMQTYAEGVFPVTYYFSSGVAGVKNEFNVDMVPMNFETGVMTMREYVGIIDKGEDHDYSAAEAFVDWFGAADLQGQWAEAHGTWPVNPKAQYKAGETIREISEVTDTMQVDWDFVRENIDAWVEKIELDILP